MSSIRSPSTSRAIAAGGVVGALAPGTEGTFEALITPVLGALLFVTFLQVPFTELQSAFADHRFLASVMALNFVIVPPAAYGLSLLAPAGDAVQLGVLVVLLTPCIDYVIVFTRLAGGDDRRLLAAAPLLMLAQMLFLPLYLFVFMGSEVADIVEPGPFIEAFLTLIVLPLALAWATEAWATRNATGRKIKDAADLTPVALMAATLLVVVASQYPRVSDELDQVAGVVPLYVGFLAVATAIGVLLARRVGLDAEAGRALAFSGATRNSLVVLPLALALPAGYAITGAVIVTQTLVEVLGMLVLVRLVPRWLSEA